MRFLVTAGGTREYLDPVRFISNASSGRMGVAIARAALQAGHAVTLIVGPTALRLPGAAKVVRVENAAEMFDAVRKRFGRCDCLVMAAAVADYAPVRCRKRKIGRTRAVLQVSLKPTRDIVAWAGRHKKKGQIVVGFALQDRDIKSQALRKMKQKRLDIVVANAPSAIGGCRATVHLNTAGLGWVSIKNAEKSRIARKIVAEVERLADCRQAQQCGPPGRR